MGSLWNRSGTIERYADDLRADGAEAAFFQGGTTSPLTVYADSGESDALPHPVVADANGRWPDIYVPYTTSSEGYDVQVRSRYGEQLSYSIRVPNPNPVDVSVIIPPERQVQTGMVHPEFTNAPKTGYCRLNGKTIGNGTTSGPNSERAHLDTIDLYRYCWNNMPNEIAPVLPVGRGLTADSDFGANKTLTLPSMRGASFSGLDDMGNSPAGSFTGLAFTVGNTTIPGSMLGANSVTLTVENMPAHVHTGSTSTHLGHVHSINGSTTGQRTIANPSIPAAHRHLWGAALGPGNGGEFTTNNNVNLTHTHSDPTVASGIQPGTGAFGTTGAQNSSITGDSPTLDHTHTGVVGGTSGQNDADHLHFVSLQTTALPGGGAPGEGAHAHTFTTDSKGGEQLTPGVGPFVTRAFNNMPVTRLVTWYIKL